MPSTDNLTIDTPEQIALELPLAGLGSRFLALLLDSLFQVALYITTILCMLVIGALFPEGMDSIGPIATVVVILFYFCLYWGYFAFFEIIWNGQTPGKRIIGIRVIKESGRPVSPVEAIGRNLMRTIDLIGLYSVGVICILLNKRNKRLGDFVAGTIVIYEKAKKTAGSFFNLDSPPGNMDFQTMQVTPEILLLIETFLARRHELDRITRGKTAREIATLLQEKTGIEASPGQSHEDFLASVAHKVRDNARYR